MSKKNQVILLAGGQGSRLRPYTAVLPKPLMPVGEIPIAEIIIRQFYHFNLRNIVISTGHLAGLIESYFGNGKRWGVNISYVHETKPLGTAGAIRLIKNIEDNFIVINGDILTDIHFKNLLSFHKQKRGIATITIKERIVKTDFGVIDIDGHGQLLRYTEKPEHKSFVSTGINVFHKRCRDYIKADESIGIPEFMLRMKDLGEKVFCYPMSGLWMDLGRHDDFELAQYVFQQNKKKFLIDG